MRKAIARVLTVISQTQKTHLRAYYHGKKYKPKDLRLKTTRAKRLALSPAEKSKRTLRQKKRAIHFPLRKYAVKA